jgi:hypothetical protein
MNSQHENTNSKDDFVIKDRILKISGRQKKSEPKISILIQFYVR